MAVKRVNDRFLQLFILVFILVMPIAFSLEAIRTQDSALDIVTSEISPNPARPGEDLLVKVNIENYAEDPALNVVMEIEGSNVFLYKYSSQKYASGTNDQKTITLKQIAGRSNTEVNFYFQVNPNAKSGEYELEFKIISSEGTVTKKIPIKVEGKPDLILTNTALSSSKVAPKDTFTLNTTLASVGNGIARNVRVSLDLNDSSPFSTLGDNVVYIDHMNAGEEEQISFTIIVGSNAEVKSYKIPLKITAYDDSQSTLTTSLQAVGIQVINKAQLDIANAKIDPVFPAKGDQVTLLLRVENVGEGKADSVKVSLQNMPFSGTTEAFIGKLDPDDDAPAQFTFIPDKSGKSSLNVLITYTDDLGEHKVSDFVKLEVKSKSYWNYLIIIPILIIIAIAANLFLRKKDAKK